MPAPPKNGSPPASKSPFAIDPEKTPLEALEALTSPNLSHLPERSQALGITDSKEEDLESKAQDSLTAFRENVLGDEATVAPAAAPTKQPEEPPAEKEPVVAAQPAGPHPQPAAPAHSLEDSPMPETKPAPTAAARAPLRPTSVVTLCLLCTALGALFSSVLFPPQPEIVLVAPSELWQQNGIEKPTKAQEAAYEQALQELANQKNAIVLDSERIVLPQSWEPRLTNAQAEVQLLLQTQLQQH